MLWRYRCVLTLPLVFLTHCSFPRVEYPFIYFFVVCSPASLLFSHLTTVDLTIREAIPHFSFFLVATISPSMLSLTVSLFFLRHLVKPVPASTYAFHLASLFFFLISLNHNSPSPRTFRVSSYTSSGKWFSRCYVGSFNKRFDYFFSLQLILVNIPNPPSWSYFLPSRRSELFLNSLLTPHGVVYLAAPL